MNNSQSSQSENDFLDKLLAQPAEIANRDFDKRISHQLQQTIVKRKHVFASMGVIWLVLASILGSPRTLLESIESLASLAVSWLYSSIPLSLEHTANQLTSSLSTQLTQEMASIGRLISQSSTTGIFILGLLVCTALFLLLREQF